MHYILLKGSIDQKDSTIINIYALKFAPRTTQLYIENK